MTREEREAIEGRYAVRDVDKYPCRAAFSGTCPSGRDVNLLLAALDEMEADHQMSVNEAALSIKHLKTARDLHKRRAETLDVELRADRGRWKGKCECTAQAQRTHYCENCEDTIVDRDRWKARAEALERAMKWANVRCVTCGKRPKGVTYWDCPNNPRDGLSGCERWEFDESRFSGEIRSEKEGI